MTAAEAKGASESDADDVAASVDVAAPEAAAAGVDGTAPADEEAQLLAAVAAAGAKVAEAKAARLEALRTNIKALVAEAARRFQS